MALLRVQVTLRTVDNNPANFITNTMYWDDNEAGTYSTLVDEIKAAYDEIGTRWSVVLATNNHEVQFYRMSDPEPRAPVFTGSFNLAAVGTSSLPRECAMCCSFQAPKISGVPQSRRRGRLYIGPFSQTALDGNTGNPTSTAITAVVALGESLLSYSQGQADWKWAVYSTVLETASEVSDGWVDNAWDTQRRRGNEWTARTTFI